MQFEPHKVTISVILTGLLTLIFAGAGARAIDVSTRTRAFHQVQSNFMVNDDEDEYGNRSFSITDGSSVGGGGETSAQEPIQIKVDIEPIKINLEDFIPTALRKIFASTPVLRVRVNLFPVLDYGTKMFIEASSTDPIYGVTRKLDGIHFSAGNDKFNILSWPDKKYLRSGANLGFDLEKGVYTLDGQDYPFENIYISRDGAVTTSVQWTVEQDQPREIDIYGDFVVTKAVTPRGAPCIKVVNVVELETYVAEVVPSEMEPHHFSLEALKVQADLVRGDVLYMHKIYASMKCDFDVKAGIQDQELGSVEKENEKSNAAVAATRGEALMYGERLALPMYSSNPGFRTVACQDYFQCAKNLPYLISIPVRHPDKLLAESTVFKHVSDSVWVKSIQALNTKFKSLPKIDFPNQKILRTEPLAINNSGRATQLKIIGEKTTITLTGKEFLQILHDISAHPLLTAGHSEKIVTKGKPDKDGISFISYGNGHGVGFPQAEAKYLDEDDHWSHSEMLMHYFPGTKLVNIYKTSLPQEFSI